MAKQQSKDELMAELFRMLMADAQQAEKQSAPHEVIADLLHEGGVKMVLD